MTLFVEAFAWIVANLDRAIGEVERLYTSET